MTGKALEIIRTGKKLAEKGLIVRSWGNISAREGKDSFLITASGRNYMSMSEEDVIRVSIRELSFSGDVKPSSEMRVHREIYRIKPEAEFIIHTHQSNGSAVSAMGLSIVEPGKSGEIICAQYGLPGSELLAAACSEAVKKTDRKAVIMKNHGAVCWGKDAEEALKAAEELEEECGKYLEALGIDPWKREDKDKGKYRDKEGRLWNRHPLVVRFTEEEKIMRPYLDDFAQMAGTGLKVAEEASPDEIKTAEERGIPLLIKGKGLLCAAGRHEDEKALFTVVEKNCRAFYCARAGKGRPLDPEDCMLMRKNYVKSYSRLFKQEAFRSSQEERKGS